MTEKTNESIKPKKQEHPAKPEPRNFLATLLLVIGLGPLGVNRLYTGETTLGWIRFGLFIGGVVFSPFMIGFPLLFVAHVWGWVDVFLVYHGEHTDVDGKPFAHTKRDLKLAKILYIIFIITLVISIICFLLFVMLVALTGTGFSPYNYYHGSPEGGFQQYLNDQSY